MLFILILLIVFGGNGGIAGTELAVLIAAVGVEDLVIAEGDSAILVCPISQAQRVKQVVEQLEKEGRDRFL